MLKGFQINQVTHRAIQIHIFTHFPFLGLDGYGLVVYGPNKPTILLIDICPFDIVIMKQEVQPFFKDFLLQGFLIVQQPYSFLSKTIQKISFVKPCLVLKKSFVKPCLIIWVKLEGFHFNMKELEKCSTWPFSHSKHITTTNHSFSRSI